MRRLSEKSEVELIPTHPKVESIPEVDQSSEQIVARLRLLWDERRLLCRVGLYGLVIATIIAFLIPKQYESTARLMPPDDQSNGGMALLAVLGGKAGGEGGGGGLGAIAGDMLGIKSSGELFVGLLQSRTVQDNIIKKFDLKKIYGKEHGEDARIKLASNTALSADRKSGIITITVTDHDPSRAAAVAQQYVEELNAVVSHVSTSAARRERIFLEGRLQEVKQDLQQAEKEFSEFANQTGAIDIKEQGKAMVTAAATLQGEMIAAESQLEGLRQIYTDNNVRVRSLRARVAELNAQLEKVGGKGQGSNGSSTPQNDDSLYPSIRKLPLLGVTYADLYRRTKVQETVFEVLTQQYELARVNEAKEIPTVKVLDPANVPEKKSFPPRFLIVLLGISCSMLGTATWLYGRARWQETDAQDPRKNFASEVYQTIHASMPWATHNGSPLQAARHRLWTRWVQRNGQSHNVEVSSVIKNDDDIDG
jgi:uncharacterized protein involved in exopolysaccharide biosynthesis